jgi:hypothetical protein
MDFRVVVVFIDFFMDDVTYLRDAKVCRIRFKEYRMDIELFERTYKMFCC